MARLLSVPWPVEPFYKQHILAGSVDDLGRRDVKPERRLASSIATPSAFTTGRMSVVDENLAIRLRPASFQ